MVVGPGRAARWRSELADLPAPRGYLEGDVGRCGRRAARILVSRLFLPLLQEAVVRVYACVHSAPTGGALERRGLLSGTRRRGGTEEPPGALSGPRRFWMERWEAGRCGSARRRVYGAATAFAAADVRLAECRPIDAALPLPHSVRAPLCRPSARNLRWGPSRSAHPMSHSIAVTIPAPTVLPPSRTANRIPFSIPTAFCRRNRIVARSPGFTKSSPTSIIPVTSVVPKKNWGL